MKIRKQQRLPHARKVVSTALLMACLMLAGLVLLPGLLGFERYVITGGSMSGTYDRGSLLYAKAVPTSALRVGDVITYAPPPGSGPGGLVTHRIHSIAADRTGTRVFRTKGDANRRADPWSFTLDRPVQPRAVDGVPHLGYALAALALRPVRILVIGLPALLIAFSVLARLWTEAGAEQKRRQAASAGAGASAA